MENLGTNRIQNPPDATEEGYTPASSSSLPATDYGDPSAEYAALTEAAALVDRSYKKLFRLSGRDPAGMLAAILTNEVPKEPGRGVYAALLNPKGRIQTDLRVLKAGGDVLVDTEPEGGVAATEILGRYAPFSRVKLDNLSEFETPWGILGLYGPQAENILGELGLAEHETSEVRIAGTTLLAAGVAHPVAGYDLLGPSDVLQKIREHLAQRGAVPAGLDAFETARIAAGVPRFGADISPDNFPGECGILERAVSFKKGCYPGQETVARMYYRGHPNRTLHRFAVAGPSPEPDTPVEQNGKPVGRVTSVAPLLTAGRRFALGYLTRNADPESPLHAGEATIGPSPVTE